MLPSKWPGKSKALLALSLIVSVLADVLSVALRSVPLARSTTPTPLSDELPVDPPVDVPDDPPVYLYFSSDIVLLLLRSERHVEEELPSGEDDPQTYEYSRSGLIPDVRITDRELSPNSGERNWNVRNSLN